jgi:hypothetical protein
MFPLWFALLGGSFVFLDVGPSFFSLYSPFFGCFGLFMIVRVSLSLPFTKYYNYTLVVIHWTIVFFFKFVVGSVGLVSGILISVRSWYIGVWIFCNSRKLVPTVIYNKNEYQHRFRHNLIDMHFLNVMYDTQKNVCELEAKQWN